jgi:hypothetical protein
LEREGIWDRHLEINLQMPEGFVLTVNPNASATVNGDPVRRRALRNGDAIQVGGTRLQFSLTPTRQTDLRVREFFTWLGLIFLCGVQVGLIYQVLR